MYFEEISNKMRTVQNNILEFLDKEYDTEENYEILTRFIETNQLENNKHELKLLLYLISSLANNHHRSSNFFDKIEKILLLLQKSIKTFFSNIEIFTIFEMNKRILLFLIQSDIIQIEKTILNKIKNNFRFFLPEIKKYIENEKNNTEENIQIANLLTEDIFDDYFSKRKIGENEEYICELIRKDDIEKFIIFVKKNDIALNCKVSTSDSIYETNLFLYDKEIELIEYASFFGAIQIFKYLYLNGIKLNSSLWIFGIHGDHPELIHILIDNKIVPENENYYKCLEEAIKCHHNDMAFYIINNFLNQSKNGEIDFDNNILSYAFHYYNFSFFTDDYLNHFLFDYACIYDYYTIVEFFLKTRKMYLKNTILFICF